MDWRSRAIPRPIHIAPIRRILVIVETFLGSLLFHEVVRHGVQGPKRLSLPVRANGTRKSVPISRSYQLLNEIYLAFCGVHQSYCDGFGGAEGAYGRFRAPQTRR